jgi:CzcA family heavy metal efflux pump
VTLTDRALANRTTVLFAVVAAAILGFQAWSTLPRESFPDITVPVVVVTTIYPGAAPAEVERQITDRLERELRGLADVKRLSSVSSESASVVTIEFESGTEVDFARQKVRDRVDLARADFPSDVEEPLIQEVNFSDIPILQINLAGELGPVVLKQLAKNLRDDLETIPGVLRVDLVGGLDREVQVDIDPERLRLYGLSLEDVITAVRAGNLSIPGGELEVGDSTFAVRVPNEVDDPRTIADFAIEARDGRPLFIRDVARVSLGFEDRASIARIDGRESIALAIQKRTGANLLAVADAARAEVELHRASWPTGLEVVFLGDQSEDVEMMVTDLQNNILTGLVLVVVVLMTALGLRNASFVGLAIPLAMLMTFVVVELAGFTLNTVVLFGLVMAVGMLVDNAVVVVENIYRHMQQGRGRLEAASLGTRQVGTAILVSTLTTVAAFAPLLFWPGVVGDFMKYLPLTVSIALAASLLIAFTVNPVLCAAFMTAPKRDRRNADDDPDAVGADDESGGSRAGRAVILAYRRSLDFALRRRSLVVGLTLLTFVVVVMLFGRFNHGVEFFPETEPRQIVVDLDLPPGTALDRTDAVTRELERRLAGLPDVRVIAASVGAGSQADFGGSAQGGQAARARLLIDLIPRKERSISSFVTMDEVRRRVAGIPGATLDVSRPAEGPPVGDPVSIEIRGDDFETLGQLADRIRALIEDIPGLVSLDDDFDLARPELLLRVDRVAAARAGLDPGKIAADVRTAVNGTDASTWRRGDEDVDIVVRFAESRRRSVADLEAITLVNEAGVQIPLSTVAAIERNQALTAITHKELKRVVTVTGRVTSPELAEPVRAEARARIEAEPSLVPAGVTVAFAGQSEDEDEAKAFLSKAFLWALLLVAALIVGQFDSLAVPFIVMTSVVMSMIGVLLGLLVTGLPFGIVMTGLGVISLAGIVVNNAIVLLDYGEQLRARGLPRAELVRLTGERRLRPVLLTAVTTALGMLPLATGVDIDFVNFTIGTGGESSQWWQGLAVAVIFGLGVATFLTLILVPVLYDLLLERRERRVHRGVGLGDDTNPV